MGATKPAGKPWTMVLSASIPPEEHPITTIRLADTVLPQHPRSKIIKITESTMLTTIEARHPRRLEKNRNIRR